MKIIQATKTETEKIRPYYGKVILSKPTDVNKYSICKTTRFLVVEKPSGEEYIITNLKGRKTLQKIYRKLATEIWGKGSVGQNDLLDSF